jgi:hypothetical protein
VKDVNAIDSRGWGLHHERRHCANKDSFSDATFTVARYVTCDLTATGRVANMDGIL